jgi:hypothetical protein
MPGRCQFIKKSGEQCQGWAVNGSDLCIFHVNKDLRKEVIERPLSREERIIIISRQIRSLKRSKTNALNKSREMRALLDMLAELEGEGKKENKNGIDSVQEKINKWKSQT